MTSGRIGVVGRTEIPVAGFADELPAPVGLQRVVMRTDPPRVVDVRLAAFFHGNDVIDLEEPVVGARLHSTRGIASVERSAQLGRDVAFGARDRGDVIAVAHDHRDRGVIQ
jgi:hypothetical protein